MFGLAIKHTLVFSFVAEGNSSRSCFQSFAGTSIISDPHALVTILYTAKACLDITALTSLLRNALAASSNISLDPLPTIIFSVPTDSWSAIKDLSFLESPSGYKCKSLLKASVSIAFGDGPSGFSLLASFTTLSGLYSATTSSIERPGS